MFKSVVYLESNRSGLTMPGFNVFGLLLVCLVVCGATGCGGFDADSAVKEANGTNAQRLVNLYQYHQLRNSGEGPKDELSFRAFIGGMNPLILGRMEVDANSLDELFVSARDGQPFNIRYGLKGSDRGPAVPTVFEQEGVDGKRLVACTQMVTKEVEDESEYQELLESKGLPVDFQ